VTCAGCAPHAAASGTTGNIAWESVSGRWGERLWLTALATSAPPARVFAELSDGRLAPALGFALLAEGIAIGSLLLAVAAAGWLVAPDWCRLLVADPTLLGLTLALPVAASIAMVGFHALWGLCLEVGARGPGSAPHYRQGLRFGLYACGWDLLTSPAGVVQGVLARGPLRAWKPILDAARVPRMAMRAYLSKCRGLDAVSQRRGVRLSILVLGATLFVFATPLIVGFVWALGVIGVL
jgi:hypothetical protein